MKFWAWLWHGDPLETREARGVRCPGCGADHEPCLTASGMVFLQCPDAPAGFLYSVRVR